MTGKKNRKTGLQPVRGSGFQPEAALPQTVQNDQSSSKTDCKSVLPSELFVPFDLAKPVRSFHRHLPHWRQDEATYFVSFRLSDSVPAPLLSQWKEEREIWMRHHPEPWSGKTLAEYEARFVDSREEWLDRGHGSCVLRHPNARNIVADAMKHFDGDRLVLDSFVIMPNHVHALVKPLAGHELSKILQSWKRHTSREIHRAMGGEGTSLWMEESHNHIVRDWAELETLRRYIEENPEKAKLSAGEYSLFLGNVLLEKIARREAGADSGRRMESEATDCKSVTPTDCKSVLRVAPPFEICQIVDHDDWKKLPGEMVYVGPYVQIEVCRYLTPSRPKKPVEWTIAHRKSAVAVAPVTEDGRFVLVHQERMPIQRSLWEFPAGQLDDGESREAILATAWRELNEEAGCEPAEEASVTPLGWFFGSQGFTTEHVYLFVVGPVRIVRAPQPVGGEHIGEVRLVTAAELREMVASQVIQDALTLALYARMAARGMV